MDGLLAKFATEATPDTQQARISVWNVSAIMPGKDVIEMNMDNDYHDEEIGFYMFTVMTEGSEVAGVYDIIVTFKDRNGLETSPNGITFKITDATGSNVLDENATGVFSGIGSFLPGETSSNTYRLYLKVDVDTPIDIYSVEVAAVIKQAD